MNLKLIAIILILVITLNLVFFVIGAINQLSFWVTVIIIAIIAYKVLPKIKKKEKKSLI